MPIPFFEIYVRVSIPLYSKVNNTFLLYCLRTMIILSLIIEILPAGNLVIHIFWESPNSRWLLSAYILPEYIPKTSSWPLTNWKTGKTVLIQMLIHDKWMLCLGSNWKWVAPYYWHIRVILKHWGGGQFSKVIKTAFAKLGIFFLWKKSGLELKRTNVCRDECGELVYHLKNKSGRLILGRSDRYIGGFMLVKTK